MGETMKKSNVILLALFAFACTARAEFVSLTDAAGAAKTLLSSKSTSARRLLKAAVAEEPTAATLETTNGTPFYAFTFASKGTVIMSSDTTLEPVIAFAKDGSTALEKGSPLWTLLNSDLSSRAASASAPARWARLLSGVAYAEESTVSNSVSFVEDVRVAPFVETKWSQDKARGTDGTSVMCYNYYVPQPKITRVYADGTTEEGVGDVPCGCVATAMAQVMRYWKYPVDERKPFKEKCQRPADGARFIYSELGQLIDLVYTTETDVEMETTGGSYAWDLMPALPAEGVTEEQCQAIGKLTYDCGVAVKMMYGFSETGGSGAYMMDVDDAFRDKFGYKSVAFYGGAATLTGDPETRAHAILSNLDAGSPVLLGISGGIGGHAIVADGYGFSGPEETTYVHLNMGWGGQNDVWYNLPIINVSDNPENFSGFDVIDEVVYNLWPTNAGEVVSGRVTRPDGSAAAAAVVIAATNGIEVARTETSETGIYAFIVPAGYAYDIRAVIPAEDLVAEGTTDVIRQHSSMVIGNRWGNDLELKPATVRFGTEIYEYLDSALLAARLAATNDAAAVQTVDVLRATTLFDDFTVNFRCAVASTNADAFATPVLRPNGAGLFVSTNDTLFAADVAPGYARLSVSNLAFEAVGETVIGADGSGAIDLAGAIGIELIETIDAENLHVSAPIRVTEAIRVSAADMEAETAFATYAGTADEMASSASKFVNAANDKLFGVAEDDGTFVWRAVSCDPLIAFVRIDSGATTSHYMRLDYAIDQLNDVAAGAEEPAAIALLRPVAELTQPHELKADLTLVSTGGCTVAVGPDAGFTVGDGTSLVVSNLTLTGYCGPAFFTVNGEGAGLTLEDGAVITGFEGTDYSSGVIRILKGAATLRPGAVITDCSSLEAGGAVYVQGENSVLNLEGGEISDCYAGTYGGGVYSWKAPVNVSGPLTVRGNASANFAADDIFLDKAAGLLTLVGELTGPEEKSIGVRYSAANTTKECNELGGAFANVGDGVDAATAADACAYFLNDTADLVAAVSEDGASLVWAEPPVDDGQVEPADATVLVVYGDGATTNYYGCVETAFERLTGDPADVVVLAWQYLTNDVTVVGDVTLRSTNRIPLLRFDECSIYVPSGASLAVTNLVFQPLAGSDSQFKVEGGELTLLDGTEIYLHWGDGVRDAAAVTVWERGVFTMESGAAIVNSGNDYTNAVLAASGIGGAVHLSNATGYFRGGVIEWCWADRAGGVVAGNGSTVYVSGDLRVVDNTKLDMETLDNFVVQDSSSLYLDGELTGEAEIGMTPGVNADTNFIGYVENWQAWDYAALTNSAVRFVNDVTGDRGVAVTNAAESTALLVWRAALSNPSNGVYTVTADDGTRTVYAQVGDGSEVPDFIVVNPSPIAFTSIDRLDDGSWNFTLTNGVAHCVYTLWGAPVLPPAWTVATNVVLAADAIAPDGSFTFTVGADTTNRFWKATAEPGVIEE